MEQLTHFKKLLNPNYLGAYSLTPGQDMLLTIREVKTEMVVGPDGKREECPVAYFKEESKPMILNATNMKMIAKLHKTPFVQQWKDKQVLLYSKEVNAFGTTTDALRIRDFLPQVKELDVTDAMAKLDACETLDDLKSVYTSLTKAEQSNQKVKDRASELKQSLAATAE